jgi:hypothetical protein
MNNIPTLSVYDIIKLLLNDFRIAIGQLDRAKRENQPPEIIKTVYDSYVTAKHRWQCLYQVHGSMLGNTNWEAPFVEFCMQKKYSSVDECISQARSYEKYELEEYQNTTTSAFQNIGKSTIAFQN